MTGHDRRHVFNDGQQIRDFLDYPSHYPSHSKRVDYTVRVYKLHSKCINRRPRRGIGPPIYAFRSARRGRPLKPVWQ